MVILNFEQKYHAHEVVNCFEVIEIHSLDCFLKRSILISLGII